MAEQTIWFMVADLDVKGPNGEDFAVIKVDTADRAESGGCHGTVVSLHHDRAEAEADAASWTSAEQFDAKGGA